MCRLKSVDDATDACSFTPTISWCFDVYALTRFSHYPLCILPSFFIYVSTFSSAYAACEQGQCWIRASVAGS